MILKVSVESHLKQFLLSCNAKAFLCLLCKCLIAPSFGSSARCCAVESLHCSGRTTMPWKFCNQICISSFLLSVTNPLYVLLSFKRSVNYRCIYITGEIQPLFMHPSFTTFSDHFVDPYFFVSFHLPHTLF